jgi:hypothetical protein
MIWMRSASPGRMMPGGYEPRLLSVQFEFCVVIKPKEIEMAKGQQKGNRETKKPKKEKVKVIAAAPSQKTAGWQPTFAGGKKK